MKTAIEWGKVCEVRRKLALGKRQSRELLDTRGGAYVR